MYFNQKKYQYKFNINIHQFICLWVNRSHLFVNNNEGNTVYIILTKYIESVVSS